MLLLFGSNCPVEEADVDMFIRHSFYVFVLNVHGHRPEDNVGICYNVQDLLIYVENRYLAASAHRRNTGTGGDIYLWELAGGRLLHKLVAGQLRDIYSGREVASLAFSPDSKLIAGGGIQNLVLWSTSTGQIEQIFPSPSGGVMHIRFSKDSRTLTTIRNFYIAGSLAGEEALVYPSVCRWDSRSGKRLDSPGTGASTEDEF